MIDDHQLGRGHKPRFDLVRRPELLHAQRLGHIREPRGRCRLRFREVQGLGFRDLVLGCGRLTSGVVICTRVLQPRSPKP